jgi:hypothetical protein
MDEFDEWAGTRALIGEGFSLTPARRLSNQDAHVEHAVNGTSHKARIQPYPHSTAETGTPGLRNAKKALILSRYYYYLLHVLSLL